MYIEYEIYMNLIFSYCESSRQLMTFSCLIVMNSWHLSCKIMIQPLEMEDFLDQGIQDTDVHIRWANKWQNISKYHIPPNWSLLRIKAIQRSHVATYSRMLAAPRHNVHSKPWGWKVCQCKTPSGRHSCLAGGVTKAPSESSLWTFNRMVGAVVAKVFVSNMHLMANRLVNIPPKCEKILFFTYNLEYWNILKRYSPHTVHWDRLYSKLKILNHLPNHPGTFMKKAKVDNIDWTAPNSTWVEPLSDTSWPQPSIAMKSNQKEYTTRHLNKLCQKEISSHRCIIFIYIYV